MIKIQTESGLLFIITFLLGSKEEDLESLDERCQSEVDKNPHFTFYHIYFSSFFLIKNLVVLCSKQSKEVERAYKNISVIFIKKLFFFLCL
jgi:hypothetical protein